MCVCVCVSVIFILRNNNNRKTRVHAVFSVNIKCREPNANFCHLEIDDALLTINAVDEQYKKGGKYHTHAHAARGSAEEKTTYNNIIYIISTSRWTLTPSFHTQATATIVVYFLPEVHRPEICLVFH